MTKRVREEWWVYESVIKKIIKDSLIYYHHYNPEKPIKSYERSTLDHYFNLIRFERGATKYHRHRADMYGENYFKMRLAEIYETRIKNRHS